MESLEHRNRVHGHVHARALVGMHTRTDVRVKQKLKRVFPLGWHNSRLCMSLYGAELHQHEHTRACQHRILHALAHLWVDSCVNEDVYGWDPADRNTVREEVSLESSTSQTILAAPAVEVPPEWTNKFLGWCYVLPAPPVTLDVIRWRHFFSDRENFSLARLVQKKGFADTALTT